ncbi:MAG: DUF58 domain-containing protein [Prevotella sp.]|nr:DUF58 domain-containing protein [Prevotella sp.]
MYLRRRFYLLLLAVALVTGLGYAYAPLFTVGRLLTLLLLIATLADVALLWHRRAITAERRLSTRFSNGDDNPVTISVESTYPFPVRIEVIDELPFQFQQRDFSSLFSASSPSRLLCSGGAAAHLAYSLRPTRRGVYSFGHVLAFASTHLGLVERRYRCASPCDVCVYPSFQKLHQYELMAISQNLQQPGIKRIRRIGHNTEFEHIRDYLRGDDYRTVNWRATARLSRPMVNVYQDERSQQVFCIVDKGRVMQQAFEGMTLLDYAINASLALSYVAMRKEDRAGLITFNDNLETFVAADRRPGHINKLMETLYAEQTNFEETDFSALSVGIGRHISKHSLLILFTNFMGLVSLQRQLPFLQQIARRHRLLVVFFDDVELQQFVDSPAATAEQRCQHEVAEKFVAEKQFVSATLRQYGILSLLTSPLELTVDVINRYLAVRAF